MRQMIFAVLIMISILVWSNLFAIEKLYIDDKGFRHFSCGVEMRGAHIEIKDIGRDRFRVRSSLFSGILTLPKEVSEGYRCTGLLGAVRMLCGYCESPTTEGKAEDRRKQLGLHSAE